MPRWLGALVFVVLVLATERLLTWVLALFLFHPHGVLRAEVGGHEAEEVHYPSEDGVELVGYYVPPRARRQRTVLVFHGNATTASEQVGWAEVLGAESAVFFAEYRGYGASDGTPSARGIECDAEAAVRYLREVRGTPSSELVVIGRSLGGAAAIHVLAGVAHDARAGVIDSTFTSLHAMSSEILGIPLTYLVRDGYALDSLARAPRVRAPVFQTHGDADALIPLAQAQALHAALSEDARLGLRVVSGGPHARPDERTMRELLAFVRAH